MLGARDAWWCVLLFSPLPFHLDAFPGDGEEDGFWWEICSRQISNVCWKDLGITLCWLLLFPRTLTFVVSCMLQHIMLIAGLSQAFSMSKCSVLWSFCFFQDGESVFFVCFGFGDGWFCVGFCLFIFVGCIFGCYLKY